MTPNNIVYGFMSGTIFQSINKSEACLQNLRYQKPRCQSILMEKTTVSIFILKIWLNPGKLCERTYVYYIGLCNVDCFSDGSIY